jgi:hypothetical protein
MSDQLQPVEVEEAIKAAEERLIGDNPPGTKAWHDQTRVEIRATISTAAPILTANLKQRIEELEGELHETTKLLRGEEATREGTEGELKSAEQRLEEVRGLVTSLIEDLIYHDCGDCRLPDPERYAATCTTCIRRAKLIGELRAALNTPSQERDTEVRVKPGEYPAHCWIECVDGYLRVMPPGDWIDFPGRVHYVPAHPPYMACAECGTSTEVRVEEEVEGDEELTMIALALKNQGIEECTPEEGVEKLIGWYVNAEAYGKHDRALLEALTEVCPVCEGDNSGGGIDEPPYACDHCESRTRIPAGRDSHLTKEQCREKLDAARLIAVRPPDADVIYGDGFDAGVAKVLKLLDKAFGEKPSFDQGEGER